MGGLALKQFDVVRLKKREYDLVIQEITQKLNDRFGSDIRFDVIPSYLNKKDFGDLDIIYTSKIEILDNLIKLINPKEFIKNGPVLSIVYQFNDKKFQVDFIRVKDDSYDFSLNYYSNNDLGNLIGRIFHKMGFKFGHDGLSYVVRDFTINTKVLGTLLVSTNFKEVLEFGDYHNYENRVFNELEDIFNYVTTSKYFNKTIFLLENRNHISRVRDEKRPTYMKFLKFTENREFDNNFDFKDKEIFRKEILEQIFVRFPDFKERYNQLLIQIEHRKMISEKFNGNLIKELTGLEGKTLGYFIKFLLSWFEHNKGIDNYSSEEIKTIIVLLFTSQKWNI